ncbi:hypothetical protein BpHYR1_040570 [Brachionus plicatilis]|uniref:Uncharacterized protein n=1 Tax=Brachionus plicatilis TaxID=10195 RepID=A0A3M7RH16_BRAPC|nr:hypothetical protein BpHYR1_040570 [Brachionus plicatilis]
MADLVRIGMVRMRMWMMMHLAGYGRRGLIGGGSGAELVALEKILLQFGEYMFAVGELAQRVHMRPNLLHEGAPLHGLGHVDHLLYDIVGVLVLHHGVETAAGGVISAGAHLFDEDGAFGAVRVRHTLLDYIAGELVLRQLQHLALELADNAALVVGVAVLEHMLNDVVAVLVLDEPLGAPVQLVEYGLGLLVVAVLEYALDDATAVRVRRQVVHLLEHIADYEVDGVGLATLDTLLDHVIAVLVLDALDHVAVELARHLHLLLA